MNTNVPLDILLSVLQDEECNLNVDELNGRRTESVQFKVNQITEYDSEAKIRETFKLKEGPDNLTFLVWRKRVNPSRAHLLKASATVLGVGSKQYNTSLSALHRIYNYLDENFGINEVRAFEPSMVGDHEGITAATRMVTPPVNTCWEVISEPMSRDIDPERILQGFIDQGSCKYTVDNDVLYEEYLSGKTADTFKMVPVKPAAFRQGQLVEMSFNIRVLKMRDSRIVINHLDQLVLFSRKGAQMIKDAVEKGKDISRSENNKLRVPKKRRVTAEVPTDSNIHSSFAGLSLPGSAE